MFHAAALVVAASVTAAADPGPLGPPAFAARRARLAAALPPGAVAVLRGAPDRSSGTDPYRQDSAFWYLTGIDETNATGVLAKDQAGATRYLLFVQPANKAEDQWDGFRAGVEGAPARFGADEALPAPELWERLPKLWRGASALYFLDSDDDEFRDRLLRAWWHAEADAAAPRPVLSAEPLVGALRLVKDEVELPLLRRAVDLTVGAHRAAMAAAAPGRNEGAVKAAMVRACLEGGAARMGYSPIVGSGPNSVVLHYDRADRVMQAGEMIVNDTACEYRMYTADVTRSYPVSGRFSPEQRAVYEIVLAAQKAGIEKVRPGSRVHEVYEATVGVVVDGLLRLGLLQGERDAIIRDRGFQKFYPHGCIHWLGLDVHDAGSYGFDHGDYGRRERYFFARAVLQPGMVVTVEPGIYVPEGATPDRKWWNIGVRIEDDVLVTPGGNECLSCALPREISEVEAALGRGSR
jgi:Xaa-Pro aminopeptidase